MLLNIEKSEENDKERSKEWLVNTDPVGQPARTARTDPSRSSLQIRAHLNPCFRREWYISLEDTEEEKAIIDNKQSNFFPL